MIAYSIKQYLSILVGHLYLIFFSFEYNSILNDAITIFTLKQNLPILYMLDITNFWIGIKLISGGKFYEKISVCGSHEY